MLKNCAFLSCTTFWAALLESLLAAEAAVEAAVERLFKNSGLREEAPPALAIASLSCLRRASMSAVSAAGGGAAGTACGSEAAPPLPPEAAARVLAGELPPPTAAEEGGFRGVLEKELEVEARGKDCRARERLASGLSPSC